MKAFESREDYLENMLLLGREKGYIRSTDIAQRMNFSKPSVSRAVGLLKASGYLTVNPSDGLITLTPCGLALAEAVYERHTLLARFLCALGVSEATAAEDACRMEHVLSEESFEKIKEYIRHRQ